MCPSQGCIWACHQEVTVTQGAILIIGQCNSHNSPFLQRMSVHWPNLPRSVTEVPYDTFATGHRPAHLCQVLCQNLCRPNWGVKIAAWVFFVVTCGDWKAGQLKRSSQGFGQDQVCLVLSGQFRFVPWKDHTAAPQQHCDFCKGKKGSKMGSLNKPWTAEQLRGTMWPTKKKCHCT